MPKLTLQYLHGLINEQQQFIDSYIEPMAKKVAELSEKMEQMEVKVEGLSTLRGEIGKMSAENDIDFSNFYRLLSELKNSMASNGASRVHVEGNPSEAVYEFPHATDTTAENIGLEEQVTKTTNHG